LAKRKTIRLESLKGQKFIHFERDLPTRKALDKLFKEHRVTVDPVMEMDNIETLKRAVEIDSGVSIVPQEAVRQEVANQTLAVVQLEGGDFLRPLAVVYKKGKVLSPAIKRFIALLKESL
jgi:DNA-binding transcriptional LysR family regulator